MTTRFENLIARRTDRSIRLAKSLSEAYGSLPQSESVRYVILSMQPIEPEYTKNTYYHGDRVCNQLQNRLSTACEYKYQGSVTNDTHIKARSDIDILLLISKFYMLERPQVPPIPYYGDPIQDILGLRVNAITSLEAAFPEAEVDSSGRKSITINGGSLRRKIDVVPSNWFNTNKYAETKNEIFRAVQILDTQNLSLISNTPFLHNELIQIKDTNTMGGLRKAARLLKSLKYDIELIDLSSYDLVSLAFNIPDNELNVGRGMELAILNTCLDFCRYLLENYKIMESLKVPDGHRKIFENGHATIEGLKKLTSALQGLANDVLTENKRSFGRLTEARVDY